MARQDWVMVCSSTFRASAVTHSAKRRWPGRVKAQVKDWSSACQMDRSKVASVIGASPCWVGWDGSHPSRSARQMPRSTLYGRAVREEDFRETTVYHQFSNGRAMMYVWPEKDYLKAFELLGRRFELRATTEAQGLSA